MHVYKFRDLVNGNFAFIFSDRLENAKKRMSEMTELPFEYLSYKNPNEIGTWIIFNEIKQK